MAFFSSRRAEVPHRIRGCCVWGLTVAATVFAVTAAPGPSYAGQLKCVTPWLAADDELLLRAAALKVLPKSAHLTVTGACRNPDWAIGFIETQKSVTAEGVQQWWELICRRKAYTWECDPPEFKQSINLSLVAGGATRQITLSFDRQLNLDRARRLAARAIDIYADPASRFPGCKITDHEESEIVDVHRSQSLTSGKDPIQIAVDRDQGMDTVWLNDVFVAIEFPSYENDAAELEAACWNDVVVVD
jgi:hypothetical protein